MKRPANHQRRATMSATASASAPSTDNPRRTRGLRNPRGATAAEPAAPAGAAGLAGAADWAEASAMDRPGARQRKARNVVQLETMCQVEYIYADAHVTGTHCKPRRHAR